MISLAMAVGYCGLGAVQSLVRDCGFRLESAVLRGASKPDGTDREIAPGLAFLLQDPK